MSSLPRDIIIEILARLPVRSITRFKCVCRSWLHLFDDMQFSKLHYNNQKKNNPIKIIAGNGDILFSVDTCNDSVIVLSEDVKDIREHGYPVEILGSCNGLVCIRLTFDHFSVWNPSTKENTSVQLTGLLPIKYVLNHWHNYGFGYDLKTQDFKLVVFESFRDRSRGSRIKVFSLGLNSWRTTSYDMHIPYTLSRQNRPSTLYFNGALHWLSYGSKFLVSFDLGDEIIREVPGPMENNFFDDSSYRKYVDVLGGFLCMICILPRVRGDVWVMKEYGVRESWTKLFTVPQEAINFLYFRPIGYMHNREQVLLSVRLQKNDCNVLVCYNLKCKKAKILEIHDCHTKWHHASACEESLFSVLRKQNSDGIRRYLDDEQAEQEEESSKCDDKRACT